jgi:hypothetical protein
MAVRAAVRKELGVVTVLLRPGIATNTRKAALPTNNGISQLIQSMRRPTPLNQGSSFSEFGVVGFSLLINANIGIGVLPESQEIFIPLAGGGFVAHHFLRPGHL